MRPLLSRPYQLDLTLRHRVRAAVFFGLFVFVFLGIFRPFGLHMFGDAVMLVALGYGGVCTGVMLLLNVALPKVLRHWFSEPHWTVGRELGWTLLNVGAIAMANAVFTAALGLAPWSLATIGNFTLYTVAIGSFPIALSIVLNEMRLYRSYAVRASVINERLEQRGTGPAQAMERSEQLHIPGEKGVAGMTIGMNDLVFVRSADNYVEVHHLAGGKVQRTVLRGSLKSIEDALRMRHARFLRCHKQHLVDLHKVERSSGNAQGLRLHLRGVEEAIPVSRKLTRSVRELLAVGP